MKHSPVFNPVQSANSVHLIGVLGKGLFGLAQLLSHRGLRVTGSDRNAMIPGLFQGIEVFAGHDPSHLPEHVDCIITSAAISPQNVELQEALSRGVPVLERSRFLQHYLRSDHLVSVVGSQGKTTTTALLAHIFEVAGLEPGALVGAGVPKWNYRSFLPGNGIFFAETCEYSRQLMDFRPSEIVLTHIDLSFHPETFASPKDSLETFSDFVSMLPAADGVLYYNGDCKIQEVVAAFCPGRKISYGLGKGCQVRGIGIRRHGWGSKFQIEFNGKILDELFYTPLPGHWNAKNAVAATAVALEHGISPRVIREAIQDFNGISRRFDVLYDDPEEVTVIEHLTFQPPAVRDLISETRHRYPEKQCVVLFNSYDVLLLREQEVAYASAFRGADHVILRPVEAAFSQTQEMVESFDLERFAARIRRKSGVTVEIPEASEFDAIDLARKKVEQCRKTALLVIGPPGRRLAETFAENCRLQFA